MARILVVEDNAINRELLRCVLEAWQHQALLAIDGEQGLAMAMQEAPDLVVCDLQMPRLDGLALAQALRRDPALRHLPLVALTALAREADRARALSAGFDAVLTKPIDPQALMAALQPLLPDGPLAPAPAAAASEDRDAPIAAELRAPWQPCVLLTVDDGPVNVAYKRDLLQPAGYQVLDADGVDSAMALLRRRPVDLVVSDVVMPWGGGFELLRQVRANPAWRDLPFVFLTSSVRDSASRAQGLALGAQDFLVRPLEADALLRALRQALNSSGTRSGRH